MLNIDLESLTINDNSYSWVAKSVHAVRKRLGLKIKVHEDNGMIQNGHIFLFNHFARFETIIPPYIIYRKTGAHCRSVADSALFDGSEGVADFMKEIGIVPNNLPGLLPFLAAEILRGRKVILFPEGGMVKDRRVLNSEGDYSVFSRSSLERRKHHRGAAVLALTLDMFKRRILDLEKNKDWTRIKRWVEALGLKDEYELLKRAHEPTLIVPANITFYPIRIQENLLSRTAGLFAKRLSGKFAEEMLIEGNLLFRDTDMDIRFSKAVKSEKKWRWWEKLILTRYFLKIYSLNELFSLKDRAEDMAERLLARCINDESLRIRDEYMATMYKGITVNLSHLASHVITCLIKRGEMSIDVHAFHKILYLALKNLQATPGIHLHESLLNPESYSKLIYDECPELIRFLDTCQSAGLIGRTQNHYRFLDKLCEEFGFDEVRLENPVMVYANEVEPLLEVRETVEAAMGHVHDVTPGELASFQFDDELRRFELNKNLYNLPSYGEINDKETATLGGEPYLLLGEQKVETGVLLIHGLLASPAEMRAFGEKASKQGLAVLGVRLAGHGTSPHDLKGRTWLDWMESVRRSYNILAAFCDKVVVVGFSTGGALGLLLASEKPEKLVAVAAVCTPVVFTDGKIALVPFVHGLNQIASWLPSADGMLPFLDGTPEHPEVNYQSIPVAAIHQLRELIAEMLKKLVKVEVPTCLIQSDGDPTVEPESVNKVYDLIVGDDKSIHWIGAQRHGIVYEDTGATHGIVLDFINRTGAAQAPEVGALS